MENYGKIPLPKNLPVGRIFDMAEPDGPTTKNPVVLYLDTSDPAAREAVNMLLASGLPIACVSCEALNAPYIQIDGEDIHSGLRQIKAYIDSVRQKE
ncbi:MAG: hypothetical protein A2700_02345 [Candidatus Blackburnbacteria bacterium RIFCSPHIGHO2_01_FULL_44_64]|uniref:Uncharacterized protein n=1 Tax=Candidatus Blackburnbacteria bacterium RIFCSPHIGHO2_02_FULL_44_20 TaxID=1797516 RepID=A0A1G1V508_9BACT|nr:MAG: hypothetical protein A2700_02345 [Candidatus Blackburnbacteria bacterium RIFCSPHIGHO2_01_FULL_44_64]OGY10456.1 MAG: hypothetical protein A3D26_04360 [Candidatus Blackburnbacteria bacterium RIFCSPHIGHO2_02_FULL_44_20]OGY10692.1 MAG: hypothetical protein A3E16_01770 [Candidatus Blackburnbacteria bacterium RIFCSPHIGHO2_12_FULL_44_25]OGY13386.1 MAG: hypothetical protein A3A62_01095 [Candidatus Blackburnbacteria bacterium RIFCSPLOWO2_01_FULL_44_43]